MGKKSHNSELGRALTKRRAKDAREASAKSREDVSAKSQPASSQLQSVLDASDLTELMENVSMANTMFGGPGMTTPLAPQVVVVAPTQHARPKSAAKRAREHDAKDLRIPRRPAWDEHTTPAELEENESKSFLVWRRNIAEVEESLAIEAGFGGTMLTPFEKNIHVWRQLWRVVERSDVIIQIVDGRNPLLYYCPDLYRYVVDELHRNHVLLVNKADLLSPNMITRWQNYFEQQGIEAIFFSAFKASVNEDTHDLRVMRTAELISKLHSFGHTSPIVRPGQQVTVGMVGYPNVGKSSTINVLLQVAADEAEKSQAGEVRESLDDENLAHAADAQHTSSLAVKRVAVSATPGKTKHFQTLVLSDRVLLCDCPGLVFPNFSASKAELICAGVLSIDQMRGDPIAPVSIISRRIPASILEGVYGLRFDTSKRKESGGDVLVPKVGHVTAEELLETHARARGFMSDHDKPDTSRSARVLLKEYVSGRILFAQAPPPAGPEDGEFGIGPDVFARKGQLVHARTLASEEAVQNGQLLSQVSHQKTDDKDQTQSNIRSVASSADTIAWPATVPSHAGLAEGRCEPVARKQRGKKMPSKPFTRIERSYYPDVN